MVSTATKDQATFPLPLPRADSRCGSRRHHPLPQGIGVAADRLGGLRDYRT